MIAPSSSTAKETKNLALQFQAGWQQKSKLIETNYLKKLI